MIEPPSFTSIPSDVRILSADPLLSAFCSAVGSSVKTSATPKRLSSVSNPSDSTGCSIRVRISSLAEEIVGLDDSAGPESESVQRAREVTRLADQFHHRYAHFIGQALQEGRFQDAQSLQYHRMRLIRDYSGLWLLAF